MNTISSNKFEEFIIFLEQKRLAIVYSDRFEGSLSKTWYHRWRSDIIGLFSTAAEALRMEQNYYNVDQFLLTANSTKPQNVDFILNLNAGNRFLGNLTLVPSVAQWMRVPIAFCDARTALVSEDKSLSKRLAQDIGFIVARDKALLNADDVVVSKPLNLGSSVGVHLTTAGDDKTAGNLVEEFIEGYDGTLVMFLDKSGHKLICAGGQLVVPSVNNPRQWIYDEAAKEEAETSPTIQYQKVGVSNKFKKMACDLASICGATSVARIDVRYTGDLNKKIEFDNQNCTFIEFNAMPTLGKNNSVNEFVGQYLEQNKNYRVPELLSNLNTDIHIRSVSYLLASGLLQAQLHMK